MCCTSQKYNFLECVYMCIVYMASNPEHVAYICLAQNPYTNAPPPFMNASSNRWTCTQPTWLLEYIYTNRRVDIPTYKIYILSIYMYIWHEEFAVGGGYVVGVRNFLSSMKRGQCKYDYQPYANALCWYHATTLRATAINIKYGSTKRAAADHILEIASILLIDKYCDIYTIRGCATVAF